MRPSRQSLRTKAADTLNWWAASFTVAMVGYEIVFAMLLVLPNHHCNIMVRFARPFGQQPDEVAKGPGGSGVTTL
mgnify:FL=1